MDLDARELLFSPTCHSLNAVCCAHVSPSQIEALLAHAMLSIPASKGFEIGSGFAGTAMRGSAHNDAFVARADGRLGTATNFRHARWIGLRALFSADRTV